ncbi:MAG: GNAT family N-acetyltransferase [Acidobacteriota bacterium]
MGTQFGFGAQPTVLRCGRCGKAVDWQDARLQVVCGCRGRLDLPPVMVREAIDDDRSAVMDLFRRTFGRSKFVAFGSLLALDDAPALVAVMKNELGGALAYRLRGDGLQIVALATDTMWQRSGVGGYLVAEVELLARRLGLPRVVFCTSNDNVPSLYFYQRRGYQLTEVVVGALVPHNPPPDNLGFAGIEVRDEIRLEKILTSRSSPAHS